MSATLPGKFLVGANYWSRGGGPRMWERFDEGVVRAELAALRAVGLDCLRVFALAPTFLPRPPAKVFVYGGHNLRLAIEHHFF